MGNKAKNVIEKLGDEETETVEYIEDNTPGPG